MEIPKLKLTLKLNSSGRTTPGPAPAPPMSAPPPDTQPAPAKKAKPPKKQPKLNDGFRPRPWRLQAVTIKTLSGYPLAVQAWTRDLAHSIASASIKSSSDLQPTFVCPQEGCHKIFDSKLKWRRHQYNHNKSGK